MQQQLRGNMEWEVGLLMNGRGERGKGERTGVAYMKGSGRGDSGANWRVWEGGGAVWA